MATPPGPGGDALRRYVTAGIDTDHECATLDEALEKIRLGMHILIRDGSAARNFDALHPLLTRHSEHVMLGSDDMHPEALLDGHINRLVARAIAPGHDVFDVWRAGALASSVAHDTHNVIAVRGGLAVALCGSVELLPLAVAGLMSQESGERVAEHYAGLERLARRFGCPLQAPLMALASLTLLVMPELKPTDRGSFDTVAFRFTSLCV